MNSMDVPSLARQMQMNMLMPSLLLPQQMGGLPSTAGMLNMNPDIINQDVIRASLGQPALASSLPNQSATMPNIVHQVAPSNGAGSAGFRCNHLHIPRAFRHTSRAWRRRIKLHLHHGEESRRGRQSRRDRRRDSRSSKSRSNHRRSSRHHRRHRRDSRRSRAVRIASDSESELDVESIRLNATQLLKISLMTLPRLTTFLLLV